ncbi:ShlB/FhaC/HecB family hemolysin secretion/activation protein [Lysobacter sp. TAF61]|uniref:ShlB/FhaC/HecB family hemolysin secretion/activation protein n=1 Tax=Lysobacter sp. TAF61 TaxID=3233072 RepID=UPI003F9CA999
MNKTHRPASHAASGFRGGAKGRAGRAGLLTLVVCLLVVPGGASADPATADFRVVPAGSSDEATATIVLQTAAAGLGAPPRTLDDVNRWSEQLTVALRQGGFPIAQVLMTEDDWRRADAGGAPVFIAYPGRIRNIVVNNTSRMHQDRLQRVVVDALCDERSTDTAVCLLQTGRLERATQVLQDLPGVAIEQAPQFSPGAGVGEVDVTFSVAQRGKPAQADFIVDNKGMQSTGAYRLGVTGSGNNHFGLGESYAATLMVTREGMWTGSLDGAIPVTANGLRAVGGLVRQEYTINAGTPVEGVASTAQIGLSYPLKRGLDRNVWLGTSLLHSRTQTTFEDFDFATRGTIDSARFSLQADNGDRAQQLRTNLWSVQGALTAGHQRNDDPADAVVKRAGGYAKANMTAFGRWLLGSSGDLFITGRTNVQWASRNLDPSEKLLAGGPDAVRAYRTDEASFDDAFIANVGLYRRFPLATGHQLQAGAFVDVARGRVNHDPWPLWESSYIGVDNVTNWRTLAGPGLSLDWLTPKGITVSVSVAKPFNSASPSWIDEEARALQYWLSVSLGTR